MRVLLDTHCWLWSVTEPAQLNQHVRALLLDSGNARYVSVATVWEVAIKVRIGKLRLAGSLHDLLFEGFAAPGFEALPILPSHAERTADLPLHHRDPFDRLLVAQAQLEGLTLVTADKLLLRYDVEVLWAVPGRKPRGGGEGVVAESRDVASRRRTDNRKNVEGRKSARAGAPARKT